MAAIIRLQNDLVFELQCKLIMPWSTIERAFCGQNIKNYIFTLLTLSNFFGKARTLFYQSSNVKCYSVVK